MFQYYSLLGQNSFILASSWPDSSEKQSINFPVEVVHTWLMVPFAQNLFSFFPFYSYLPTLLVSLTCPSNNSIWYGLMMRTLMPPP